jgi:hypothetical protein
MPRPKRPSFVIELPLATTPGDERRLTLKLKAACSLYNGCLGEAKKRLARMRESKAWQEVRALTDKAERGARAREVSKVFGFTGGDLEGFALKMRNDSWIDHHLGSHDVQTTAKRAFDAVFRSAFGKLRPGEKKRPKPRFKSVRQFRSVEGKQGSVLLFRVKEEGDRRVALFKWGQVRVPVVLDAKDAWQQEALERRTKYVRCIKRVIRGRDRFFIQVIKEGRGAVLVLARLRLISGLPRLLWSMTTRYSGVGFVLRWISWSVRFVWRNVVLIAFAARRTHGVSRRMALGRRGRVNVYIRRGIGGVQAR